MANYNPEYKGFIEILTQKNHDIVEVEVGNEAVYYIARSLETPSTGAIGSSPFIRIHGTDITDILFNTKGAGAAALIPIIEKYLNDNKPIKVQYSDNHKWRYYTS